MLFSDSTDFNLKIRILNNSRILVLWVSYSSLQLVQSCVFSNNVRVPKIVKTFFQTIFPLRRLMSMQNNWGVK